MKEIKTKTYENLKKSDLIEHPPVPDEIDQKKNIGKKKKKIYQLNRVVDTIDDKD